jgi:hypothetical protein
LDALRSFHALRALHWTGVNPRHLLVIPDIPSCGHGIGNNIEVALGAVLWKVGLCRNRAYILDAKTCWTLNALLALNAGFALNSLLTLDALWSRLTGFTLNSLNAGFALWACGANLALNALGSSFPLDAGFPGQAV